MDAARACLDKGDYSCALEYYQQVSGFNDQKNSEISLTNLANANLFKMGDLFETLGSGTGSSSTFTGMAEILASRGKTSGADRLVIQKAYADAASITEPTLQAYIRFISAMTMMNQVLASAVGADGVLTASDIVQSPIDCRTEVCTATPTSCVKPGSSQLEDNLAGSEAGSLSNASNWNGSASIIKAISAATAANSASDTLFGDSNDNGLGNVFNQLNDIGNGEGDAIKACLQRKALLTALFN